MSKLSKTVGKIFARKETDMDFWLRACAIVNEVSERPYKSKLRRSLLKRRPVYR